MALLIFMDYAPGSDLLHTGLESCSSPSGAWSRGQARGTGAGGAPGCDPGRDPLRHYPAGRGAQRAPFSAPRESGAGALVGEEAAVTYCWQS